MTIEQTVTIPADRLIHIELPSSIPAGVRARVEVNILGKSLPAPEGIDDVRQLLQKAMAENGTSNATGSGWEANVMERYAQS